MSLGWHFIEHDLDLLDEDIESVAEDFAALLDKHAAFEDFCRDRDRRP